MAHLTTPTPGDATISNANDAATPEEAASQETKPEETTTEPSTEAAPIPEAATSITVSPFYHSAVNAVTEPGRFVACSRYFVTRWMPLLGNEGTRIVLALRALGYLNPKTGERRDEIILNRAELCSRVGCSEDTLTRELGLDKKTGQPRNPMLLHFVEKIQRFKRDPHTGRLWQEENGYRVAMDDPIHPDDWPLVVEKVAEREAKIEEAGKGKIPKTQNASPAGSPKTQNASSNPQNAAPKTQNAAGTPQNASPLNGILYSSINLNTPKTAALPGVLPAASPGEAQAPETAPAPLPLSLPSWDSLGEAQQRLYLQQAERELIELYTETKTQTSSGKPSRRIILSRAQGLYQKQSQTQSQTHEP